MAGPVLALVLGPCLFLEAGGPRLEKVMEDVEELRDARGGAEEGGWAGSARDLSLFEEGGRAAAVVVEVEVVVEEEARRTAEAWRSSSSLTSMLHFFPAVAKPTGGAEGEEE